MKLIQASAIVAVASASRTKGPDGNKLRGNDRKHEYENEKDRELFLGGDGGGLGGIFGELGDGLEEMFGDGFGGGWGGSGGSDGSDGGMGGMGGMGGHQGLGSHSFGGDDFFGCSDSCTEDEICESFMQMMPFDPTPKFEDACNSKCFPKVTLDMCERLNCDSEEGLDEETQQAATTAVTRMGLMDLFNTDAAVQMMCNDCKFYSCCLDEGEVGDTTKFEACSAHLVDNAEEQALGNSVLDELANIFGEAVDGFADAVGMGDEDGDGDDGLGSVLDQMLESFGDAVEGFAEDFDVPMMWNFSVTDWGDGAVWSGTEAASGVSVFGQVAGSFMCPDTCTNEDICDDVFTGMAGPGIMEDACNAGCLPGPESCDDVCGTSATPDSTETAIAVERFIDFEAVTDMACKSCRFLTCCNGQQASDADAAVSKFDTCSELLPDPSELWTDMTDGDWTWEWDGLMDWVDSVDWSAMAEDLGLTELFGDLQSLLDDALADFDLEETPISCNKDTCPVAGLCEMDIDLQSIDLGDMCAKNAFFECGDGLKDACAAQCQDGDAPEGIKAPFCALCDLATCCSTSEEEGKSFEDCALAALPEDMAAVIEDGFSDGVSTSGSPPAAEEEEEEEGVASPKPSASADDAPVAESMSDAGSSTSTAGTAVVVEDALPEPTGDGSAAVQSGGGDDGEEEQAADRPAVPVQSSSSESAFEFEASRANIQDSASHAPGVSTLMGVALATFAALLVASV